MSELAQTGVAGALASLVPQEQIVIAAKFWEFFQDRPTSDAIDPVLAAQKLAIRLHQMEATESEVMLVADRLDRRLTFRPTAVDVVEELAAVRREAHSREWRAKMAGAKPMRSPSGELAFVAAGRIAEHEALGWVPE